MNQLEEENQQLRRLASYLLRQNYGIVFVPAEYEPEEITIQKIVVDGDALWQYYPTKIIWEGSEMLKETNV